MIKYLYTFISILIAILLVQGVPYIDVLSASWGTIATYTIGFLVLPSLIFLIFNIGAFLEDGEDLNSDYVRFYLRHLYGMKFVPKWPVFVWFVCVAYFIQTDHLIIAGSVLVISISALSTVIVQNTLYNRHLIQEVKNK